MNNHHTNCGNNLYSANCNRNTCHTNTEHDDSSCSCPKNRFPAEVAYAMAYVPFQQNSDVYSCEKALARGTIFPCLDKPFMKGCCK